MWLGIIALVDKLLGIVGQWFGWFIKVSDEDKKRRLDAQAKMDEAAKKGDYDAYWAARADKHSAR